MGICCSSEASDAINRRKNLRKQKTIRIIVTPATPEKKTRSRSDNEQPSSPSVNHTKGIVVLTRSRFLIEGKIKMTDKETASSSGRHNVDLLRSIDPEDKFRSLRGQEISNRRASHAGFDSRRLVDLARRPSMPAHLIMPKDSERKLHQSSACISLIQEFHSMKIVSKDGGAQSKHFMDQQLQSIMRKLKKTPSTQINSQAAAQESCANGEGEEDTKRSVSDENLHKAGGKTKKTELVTARKTSSETKMGDFQIEDPEAGDDDDNEA